jgi:hypothetical protein
MKRPEDKRFDEDAVGAALRSSAMLVDQLDAANARIAELEEALAEYRALYRWFGQDGMTDGRFVAEFERVYLADKAQAKG